LSARWIKPLTTLRDGLIANIQPGRLRDIRIGVHWTAVVVEIGGRRQCGLSSTLTSPHAYGRTPQVTHAGQLDTLTLKELAAFVLECDRPLLTSIGLAAINASIPAPPSDRIIEGNAETILAKHGADKRVAIVGHFPFVPRLRSQVGKLFVLDQQPRGDDLPADAAPDVLPGCDVVAITSMTLANHTLEELLKLCSPQALVMLLGPSTPLHPLLFDYGVDLLSGSLVTQIEPVLKAVEQGGNFRQIHRVGVRLVTLRR
jgi:uncharacterized protein (DUF4213/DUF364 family)